MCNLKHLKLITIVILLSTAASHHSFSYAEEVDELREPCKFWPYCEPPQL